MKIKRDHENEKEKKQVYICAYSKRRKKSE